MIMSYSHFYSLSFTFTFHFPLSFVFTLILIYSLIHSLFNLFQDRLESLRFEQSEVLKLCSMNASDIITNATEKLILLEQTQHNLLHTFQEIQHILNVLLSQFVLKPSDIYQIYSLNNELYVQMQQLEVYRREIKMTMQSINNRSFDEYSSFSSFSLTH
jgi:hypothetical protein